MAAAAFLSLSVRGALGLVIAASALSVNAGEKLHRRPEKKYIKG
jgi:hypothetical protein